MKKNVFKARKYYIKVALELLIIIHSERYSRKLKLQTVGILRCGFCREKCLKYGPRKLNLSSYWQGLQLSTDSLTFHEEKIIF